MSNETSTVVDRIATTQHGLLTTEQADQALGRGRKQRWVRDGRLRLVQPGVYRMAGAPPTWHQGVLAAALSTGGVVSHRAAAELWGLIQPAGYVEVSVLAARHPRLLPPAIAHRIGDLHPELAVERAGMTVTDPVRTVIDLGLVLPRWAVRDALSRGLTTRLLGIDEVQRLRDALGRPGRNGTGVMRALLAERLLTASGEESVLEARMQDVARRFGLPAMTLQHEVWHNGRFIAQVDGAYVEVRLAIEVDGFSAHSSPDAFQRDRARQNRLIALGWTVLRFTWDDVVNRPADVADAIRTTLALLATPKGA